jgi:hypothetical protein
MAMVLAVQRILRVRAGFALYEIIGRRPSDVFLDADLQPSPRDNAAHRLMEFVYCRKRASIGDEVHLTSAQTLLLESAMPYRPVRLTKPHPLAPDDGFSHALRVRALEEDYVDRLARAGRLEELPVAQPKNPQLSPTDRLFDARHPLIVDGAEPDRNRSPRAAPQTPAPAERTTHHHGGG